MKILIIPAFLLLSIEAQSALNFSVSPLSGGGINISGTGSGVVDGTLTENFWEIVNFNTDFLDDSVSDSANDADTVSGILTNTSTSASVDVTRFAFDRDGSPDDIEIVTSNDIAFTEGDEFTFSLTATYTSSIRFDQLIPGVHTETERNQDTEIFGVTTVTVPVPEPGSTGLLALSAGLLLGMRRRSKGC